MMKKNVLLQHDGDKCHYALHRCAFCGAPAGHIAESILPVAVLRRWGAEPPPGCRRAFLTPVCLACASRPGWADRIEALLEELFCDVGVALVPVLERASEGVHLSAVVPLPARPHRRGGDA